MPSLYLKHGEDRVLRYVPWARLRKNEDGSEIYGPFGAAFRLRTDKDEDYLSVTWCEFFAGDSAECERCAVEAIRNSKIDVRPQARFAVATVGDLQAFSAVKARKIRIIHEAEEDNPAHTAIRGWASFEEDLLEEMAADVWSRTISKEDVDRVKLPECEVRDQAQGR